MELTRAEYIRLLHVLDTADWVIASHEVDETPESAPYKELEQTILAMAKEFNCEDLVEYDERYKYSYTRKFEDESPSMKFIEVFENISFWDSLVDRLARRDFLKEIGSEKFNELEPMERFRKIGRYEEKYSEEFEKNGLSGIRIKIEKP
ncbi:MAG: hypothetical protein KAR40_15095 [Candidatus Sabulitectum sp.]|nr:hypothetical protein [Candidatus Sabulitectum sp.]